MKRVLLVLLALGALAAADQAAAERVARAVEAVPVLHEGRVKPLAAVARHALLALSGRTTIPVEGGTPLSASAWLLEGLTDPATANARPVVRLRFSEVAQALGLPERPMLRYSLAEITAGLQAQHEQIAMLQRRGQQELYPTEAQLVELARNAGAVSALLSGELLTVIPGPAAGREEWQPPGAVSAPDALQAAALARWQQLLAAVRQGDAVQAAAAVAAIAPDARLRAEVAYHRLAPFDWSLVLDLLCLVLLGAAALLGRRRLMTAAIASLAAGTLVHLLGLLARMWIMQRPPVATLYESVLFVGAVAALLGLVVEAVRRRGDGALVGAIIAVALHLVGRSYADDGDTLGMLGAVLNSNFWLTTHVLTITAGYAIALVAGVVAHVALAARALHPLDVTTHAQHDRAQLILALLALLFTLFGTILGGIWADQSWGRFWGWDPKENGALLIVLWLLMILHLKSAGTLGPRGFAAGLVLCDIVVAVAWFGVNLLGIGLHSYGFATGTFWVLVAFTGLEIVLAAGLWLAATLRQRQQRVPLDNPGL